jgi:hypothetical protein
MIPDRCVDLPVFINLMGKVTYLSDYGSKGTQLIKGVKDAVY